jgi:hypothetical protein
MFGKTGSILLSIGNLPPQVSRKALKAHVQGVIDSLEGTGFRIMPAIGSCDILRLTNPATGVIIHQGIISIQPAKLAFRAMDALRRKPLRGINLEVSRYRHSSFPVSSGTPLMSMSDLLGVDPTADPKDITPLKLDLVADTGMHKPAPLTKPRPDTAFAH